MLPGGIEKNQSEGKHDGRPEAYPNKQGHGGSRLWQSTAYLVGSCQALRGSLQEGPSPEGFQARASDSYKNQRAVKKMSVLCHTQHL